MVNQEESHQCHFCGTYVRDGYEYDVDAFDKEGNRKRHWLSDCRPDLVEHEIGPLCTWSVMAYSSPEDPHNWSNERVDQWNKENKRPSCYAYQNQETFEWTEDHIHFHQDRPM